MLDTEAMGRRIRRKRQEKGFSQYEFANRVGLSPSFYGHIERGTRTPSLDTLVIIANELGVGLDTLLRDSLRAPMRVDANGGMTRRDIGLLRTYLNEQQRALDTWLDPEDRDARNRRNRGG